MQLLIDIDDEELEFLRKFKEVTRNRHLSDALGTILAGVPFGWSYVAEGKWPKSEDENRQFLVTDSNGEVSVQTFYLTIDEPDKRQPYFSGMRNIIAWCPLPPNA